MKQHVDKELSYLVMAAQTSLEVFDLLDQIKGRLPRRSHLEKPTWTSTPSC